MAYLLIMSGNEFVAMLFKYGIFFNWAVSVVVTRLPAKMKYVRFLKLKWVLKFYLPATESLRSDKWSVGLIIMTESLRSDKWSVGLIIMKLRNSRLLWKQD